MDKVSKQDMSEGPAEAARYALTRRLLPVLRHHMVVHLQPIGMIYEVLDRKLAAGSPELAPVREGLAKINTLARSAVNSCLEVVTWLAPDTRAVTPVSIGLNDCLDLLRSNFMLRGFSIQNQVLESNHSVAQPALREMVTAAMIAVTDSASGPVDLVLSAELSDKQAVISILSRPGEGAGFTTDLAYRVLEWHDVVALAESHSVSVSRENSLVRMAFRVVPSSA